MSSLTPEQRGDLAEEMLPVAAHLAVLVHGDGGPEDVRQVLDGLSEQQKDALIVVLAGLVDPDQPVGKSLGWLDHDEHGALTVPSWSEERPVRDLAPDTVEDLDAEYVDEVAVARFVKGFGVEVSDAEFLVAVGRCAALGMKVPDVDRLRMWPAKTTENWINRLRKRYQRAGRQFPDLGFVQVSRLFSEDQVVAMRERSADGSTDLELSMSFDTSPETVRSICRGQRYQEFGGPIREARNAQGVQASRAHMCGHTPASRDGLKKHPMGRAA